MNVSACLVTRGDVDMQPVLDSLPPEWEVIVYNNHSQYDNAATVWRFTTPDREWEPNACGALSDLAVYGRYAAIEHATHDLIYVQDDDVIVSDPQAIVNRRTELQYRVIEQVRDGKWITGAETVVCNMPQEFRHAFYDHHSLVGFGACFHRDAPQRAFERYARFYAHRARINPDVPVGLDLTSPRILRTCDMVFTGLTPRVLVDVPKENLPYAEDAGRMYRTPGYVTERQDMLDLVRQVRDGR